MNGKRVCIVGAGVSGLHTADALIDSGCDVTVLEARSRVGGRILSRSENPNSEAIFDVGPSWFWNGQPRIAQLVRSLNLEHLIFEQYHQGDGLYQTADGKIHRGQLGFSMAGSFRIEGGLSLITNALRSRIESKNAKQAIQLNSAVESIGIRKDGSGVTEVEVQTATASYRCDHVVLSLPPRLAVEHIQFDPMLSTERLDHLKNVETWMAGQAKVAIQYEKPFWRQMGLSGDVISQLGPMAELHDASYDTKDFFALSGFLAIQPPQRPMFEASLEQLLTAQLARLFGESALSPLSITYQNWAQEKYTATDLDQRLQGHHPLNRWPSYQEGKWDDKLIWSGTESAPSQFNGYIEGALEASQRSIDTVRKHTF